MSHSPQKLSYQDYFHGGAVITSLYGYRENRRAKGAEAENAAAAYLESLGYEILCRNYYVRGGEIDLIARDGSYLVFIEVKSRKDRKSGDPAEALTERKKQRICLAARVYLMKERLSPETPVRFDVVSILAGEINLIRDAFWIE